MTRVLFVAQEKGGVGKSLVARGIAEALEGVPIIELDASPRLVELGERVSYFPVRAARDAVNRTGGRAAVEELDAPVDAIMASQGRVIVDIGANCSIALLSHMAKNARMLAARNVTCAVLVVVTADSGALEEAGKIIALGRGFADSVMRVENDWQGLIAPEELHALGPCDAVTKLENLSLDDGARQLLQGGGLAVIPRLDIDKLTKEYKFSRGARIYDELSDLRLRAMEAVKPAVSWLTREDKR